MHSIAVSVLVLLGVLLPATAKAQLFLEEGKVVLAVAPGDRINKSLTVSNTSDEEIRVKVYWEDFQYQPPFDGTKKFFPAGVGPDSLSSWVNFSPHELTLPAYGKQKIDYSISIPEKMDGGRYGVLFFERTGPSLKDNSGLDIILRVGCLFFIEPKDASREASIKNSVIQGQKITGDFINKSPMTLIPRIVYYIMEEGGMVKDRGELKTMYVPASASASWEMPLPEDLSPGQYSIVMNADLGQEHVLTKEIRFIKDSSGQVSVTQSPD